MTAGMGATTLANKILNHLRGGTAWTQPAGLYCKLHNGDPGAAGTANASAVLTRPQISFAAALNGSLSMTGTAPSWSMTTTESITHISFWDSSSTSGGNFLWSVAFPSSRDVLNGDTLTLTACGVSLTPLAA